MRKKHTHEECANQEQRCIEETTNQSLPSEPIPKMSTLSDNQIVEPPHIINGKFFHIIFVSQKFTDPNVVFMFVDNFAHNPFPIHTGTYGNETIRTLPYITIFDDFIYRKELDSPPYAGWTNSRAPLCIFKKCIMSSGVLIGNRLISNSVAG